MSWSRTFRSHPDWNGRSAHLSTHHSMDGPAVYSARHLRNMSDRERAEAHRRAYGRLHGTYVTPRQRSDLRATMENAYAANSADMRNRGYTDPYTRSRRSGRNVYFQDEMPAAPEPPRPRRRNSEYGRYADPSRASQRSPNWQDNYVDAYQWIYGDRTPRRHTTSGSLPARNVANSRYYARYEAPDLRFRTSNSRRVDPSDSRDSRWSRWFRRW